MNSLTIPLPLQTETPGADTSNLAVLRILLFGGVILIALIIFMISQWRMRSASKAGRGEVVVQNLTDIHERAVRGVLKITNSDDPSAIGKCWYILSFPVTIGRNDTNDIVVPVLDRPVSRLHARLQARGSEVLLSEVLPPEPGQPTRPRYGTFVNDEQIEGPVALQLQDEIRLGPRFRCVYEHVRNADGTLTPTYDVIEPGSHANAG